jgi:NIPSNAP
MIIEMRTYKIASGKRAEFLKILETKAIPAHQKIGMKILGPFLSIENADTFFWMRAFPDQQSRERMRNEFYEGNLWKEELEQKLMPILEKYDVVIVEAKDGLGSWR